MNGTMSCNVGFVREKGCDKVGYGNYVSPYHPNELPKFEFQGYQKPDCSFENHWIEKAYAADDMDNLPVNVENTIRIGLVRRQMTSPQTMSEHIMYLDSSNKVTDCYFYPASGDVDLFSSKREGDTYEESKRIITLKLKVEYVPVFE